MTGNTSDSRRDLETGSLASFLDFLWRHRFLIVGLTGIATLIAVVTVLVVPVQYTARAVVLPQEGQSTSLLATAASVLGTSLPDLPISGLGALGGGGGMELAVLRSRRRKVVEEAYVAAAREAGDWPTP